MKKIFLLSLITYSLFAQNFSGGFNFYQPSNDTITQKFLPNFPKIAIGNNSFVGIDANGKFSVNGKRIRFWGTNCGASAAFPSMNQAGDIAGRLRKFGFNLIRMHHLDNPGWGKSLLGLNSTRSLNEINLDLLEYYIAKLKENNVYINMNLHVSRTFRASDGVVNYDSIPEMGKVVNFFDPWIMFLHKEYAYQLLNHINPYTKKRLADDPVMAMLEITNENSLYRAWRSNQLKPIKNGGILPYRYSRMLDSLWNEFLKMKYQSTTNMQKAWNKGMVVLGEGEQIKNGGFELPTEKNYWGLEQHETATADTSRDNSNAYKGKYSFKVNVKTGTGTEWHIQYKQPTLTFQKDSAYTVSFAVKSDAQRTFSVSLMNDASPWNGYGSKSITSSTQWQVFSFSVKVSEPNNAHGRLTFQLGKEKSTFWFDEISITRAGVNGLLANESMELKNVLRLDYADCPGYSTPRVKDLSEFYIGLQRNYFKEMVKYLKEVIGVKVPIVTSNWTVGPADLASMSDGDYVDNHAYWDHPQFPNVPWSSTDWKINNKPLVTDVNASTIPTLFAGVPIAGKPFTVSEYNHPYPNQYQVESVLFTTGYSSFYDADALMYFDYDEVAGWGTDMIGKNSYFSVSRNSVYMAMFPSVAYAFRNNLIKPSVNPVLIDYSADTLYSLPKHDVSDWRGPNFIDPKVGLINAVKTQKYFAASTSNINAYQTAPASPFKTDTDEIIWNTTDGTLTISTINFNGAAGYLSKLKNVGRGNMSIIDFNQDDFGAVTWISLTKDYLPLSSKSLITICSKIQNTNQIWDGTQSLHENWGNAPTQVYPLQLKLELFIHADSIRVFPLDPKGKESFSTSFIVKRSEGNRFFVDFDQKKNKTLWFGIEKYGVGFQAAIDDHNNIPSEFRLEQNYPNPFNPETIISYQLSTASHVTLKVYDLLGREVTILVDEFKQPGIYNSQFSILNSQLTSGVFFYTLHAGNFVDTKKMILLR